MDRAKEMEIALYNKVEEAYLLFYEQGHLLDKLSSAELQDIVCSLSLYRFELGTYSTTTENRTCRVPKIPLPDYRGVRLSGVTIY